MKLRDGVTGVVHRVHLDEPNVGVVRLRLNMNSNDLQVFTQKRQHWQALILTQVRFAFLSGWLIQVTFFNWQGWISWRECFWTGSVSLLQSLAYNSSWHKNALENYLDLLLEFCKENFLPFARRDVVVEVGDHELHFSVVFINVNIQPCVLCVNQAIHSAKAFANNCGLIWKPHMSREGSSKRTILTKQNQTGKHFWETSPKSTSSLL